MYLRAWKPGLLAGVLVSALLLAGAARSERGQILDSAGLGLVAHRQAEGRYAQAQQALRREMAEQLAAVRAERRAERIRAERLLAERARAERLRAERLAALARAAATTTTTAPPTTTTTAPPAPPPTTAPPAPATAGFTCPVQGAVSFTDDFGSPRAGHSHEGVDMMAAIGTPTVAPVSGTVSHDESSLGGLSWWVDGDDGNRYYGAHLSSYAGGDGWVQAGTVIGYVGDSGNADGTPHLHFEYHPGGGSAADPYPLLADAC